MSPNIATGLGLTEMAGFVTYAPVGAPKRQRGSIKSGHSKPMRFRPEESPIRPQGDRLARAGA
jgi:hypothetical protein